MENELTNEQEEYLLECGMEKYFEEKQTRAEILFNEWLSFNLTGLQKEFIENNNEDFINFCKDGYKSECEGLI